MKTKIFPIFLIITVSITFYIFYKGLQNSNIYTPEIKSEIKIPSFEAKEFFSKDTINSDQIFIGSEFYLLNIWASWCLPCRDEHPLLINLSNNNKIEIIMNNQLLKIPGEFNITSEMIDKMKSLNGVMKIDFVE